MTATLLGIAMAPERKAPMRLLTTAQLSLEEGLVGDRRGKPGPRQLTVMSLAAWRDACDELGEALPWVLRRANLLVDELPLENSNGQRLRIGDALLEISGETDPCERMTAVRNGLFDALAPHWRGGVTCRVVEAGTVCLGMAVELLP